MQRVARVGVLLGCVLATGSSPALAAGQTGRPLTKTCQSFLIRGVSGSEGCAVVWYDRATNSMSARCTVEYTVAPSDPIPATEVYGCSLGEGRRTKYEVQSSSWVNAIPGERYGTPTTIETPKIALSELSGGKHVWQAFFDFAVFLYNPTPEAWPLLRTPWVPHR